MRPERMQSSPCSSSRNLHQLNLEARAVALSLRVRGLTPASQELPPLRGSVASCSLPRAYARGYLMASLRDWGWSGARRADMWMVPRAHVIADPQ